MSDRGRAQTPYPMGQQDPGRERITSTSTGQGQSPYRQSRSPYRQGQSPYRREQSPSRQGQPPFRQGQSPQRRGQPPNRQGQSFNGQGPPPYKRDQSPNSNNSLCWNCGKSGHFFARCPEGKRNFSFQQRNQHATMKAFLKDIEGFPQDSQ